MLVLRRILFILFSIIYVIYCPLIILDVLGINLTPRSTQNLTKTGIISLSSLPPGATIYLDNLRFAGKTPSVIRNLIPGEYSLRLILRNHRTWERVIPVKAETATVLENILLVPQIWQTQVLSYLAFEDILPIHNNSLFLVKQGPRVQDLFIFRMTESLSEQILPALENTDKKLLFSPLFPADTIYNEAKVVACFTMPQSPSLLLQINLKSTEKFLWIDLKQKLPLIDDITDLMIKKPKRILWENRDNKNIFVLYPDNTVTRLETATKAIYPNVAEHVRGWGVYNQKMYIMSQDQQLRKISFDGKDEELIAPTRPRILAHFGEDIKYQIHVYPNELILFLGEHGELLTNKAPFELVDRDVKNFDFDESSQRLLIWTEHKLGVIDFSTRTPEENLNLGPQLVWLIAEVKNIEQAFWVNHGSYIVYRDQDRVILTETEKFYNPASETIMNVKRGSSIVYSEPTGKLYYLDPEMHRLSALTLVPVPDRFAFTNNAKNRKRAEGSE